MAVTLRSFVLVVALVSADGAARVAAPHRSLRASSLSTTILLAMENDEFFKNESGAEPKKKSTEDAATKDKGFGKGLATEHNIDTAEGQNNATTPYGDVEARVNSDLNSYDDKAEDRTETEDDHSASSPHNKGKTTRKTLTEEVKDGEKVEEEKKKTSHSGSEKTSNSGSEKNGESPSKATQEKEEKKKKEGKGEEATKSKDDEKKTSSDSDKSEGKPFWEHEIFTPSDKEEKGDDKKSKADATKPEAEKKEPAAEAIKADGGDKPFWKSERIWGESEKKEEEKSADKKEDTEAAKSEDKKDAKNDEPKSGDKPFWASDRLTPNSGAEAAKSLNSVAALLVALSLVCAGAVHV